MSETTLTSKGQVTVPREIRDRLGLVSGDKLTFTLLSDGTVIMRAKTRRLLDVAGSLTRPGQPKVTVEQMNLFKRWASLSTPMCSCACLCAMTKRSLKRPGI